jgi:2-iminoacetate synthase
MSFSDILHNYNWEYVRKSIYSKTEEDVRKALAKEYPDAEDFKALVSPAAAICLEEMALKSHHLTQKRFGRTIQLYIPLYLSNECMNQCVYCGFNSENKIDRITLDDDQILNEIRAIKSCGYEHILLVTGDYPEKVNLDYFKNAIKLIRPYFSQISFEVQPLEQHEYEELVALGLHTVYVYQETYNEQRYPVYHPKGKKADFNYRLETPDRLGMAGIHKIGLGSLLGLEDWRTDAFYTAMHLKYLEQTYWKTKYSISFPRLRPHAGKFKPSSPITERELVQLITAFRLYDEDVELSMSTRESRNFRDNSIKLGITCMSAGSRTNPGGYANCSNALEQFEIHDNRPPEEVARVIKEKGYEAVWKDWDGCLQE